MFVSGLCGLASLPFHPQWSRSLQYVYASVCQSNAFGRCCMFPKSLLMTFSLFPCQYLPKTVFFEPVQVFTQSPVFTAKWHITSVVYRQCIKNYYLWQYHFLLFTNIRNVCKTKYNLVFVWKFVKIVAGNDFLQVYYSDFAVFWKFVLHANVAKPLVWWDIEQSTLLLIVRSMCQWKNFENRLVFGEDVKNDKVGHFLGHSVVTAAAESVRC